MTYLNFGYIITLLLSVMTYGNVLAQASNVNFVFPYANEYEIRIDDNKVYKKNIIPLNKGTHIVEIWVPAFNVIKDTIYVHPDSTNRFQYKTKLSNDFRKYKKEKARYNTKLGVNSIIPISCLASIGFSTYLWIDAKSLARNYKLKIEEYQAETNINLAIKYKSELVSWNEQYIKKQKQLRNSIYIGSALAVTSAFMIWRFKKKHVKPNPTYLNSPFKADKFSMTLTPTSYGISLNLHL